MSLNSIFSSGKKILSVEITTNQNLDFDLLKIINPSFCSITWFVKNITEYEENIENIPALSLVKTVNNLEIPVLLHLTGNSVNEYQAKTVLNKAKELGARNILAVQGQDGAQIPNHFVSTCKMIKFIKKEFNNDFVIGVAGYPGRHHTSSSVEDDFLKLREKMEAGADFILTQGSYDYDALQKFQKSCLHNNITIPIVVGVFLIDTPKSLKIMKEICKIRIPEEMDEFVKQNKNNQEIIQKYGLEQAKRITEIILQDNNFKGVHIFSFNNLKLVNDLINLFKDKKNE